MNFTYLRELCWLIFYLIGPVIIFYMKISEQTRSSTGSGSENCEKITDSMRKKFCIKQFIFCLYHLTRISLSLTILILISQTTLKQLKQSNPYLRIQQNLQLWSKNVIIDMITVSTYNCPKGYEPYTSARWEGTKEGCLCQTSLGEYDYVHVLPGECTLKLIDAGCTKIQPQSSIPFVFWKIQKLICIKRIPGLNFYSNLSSPSSFSTPTQTHPCSPSTPHQFPTPSSQPCPITTITNTTIHPNILPDLNFSFARQTSYPIIDIKMSEYSFCEEYNRANISPNRFENYALQIVEVKHCGDGGDWRVREIDWVEEKVLFGCNRRILDVVTDVLPAYPKPSSKYVYKLGTVEYPPWTKSCRQSDQYNLQKTKKMFQFDQVIAKSQSCLALTIVMVIIWGLLYSLICLIKRIVQIRSEHKKGILCYPKSIILRIDPNLLNTKFKLSLFSQLILFLLLLAVAIGLLVQIGVQYEYTSSTEQWMRGSYACMDNSVNFQNWVNSAYVVILQGCVRTYLICLLAGLVGVAVDVVFLVWRFNRGDLAGEKVESAFRVDQLDEKNSDDKIEIPDQNLINQKEDIRGTNKNIVDGIAEEDIEIEKQYEIEQEQDQSQQYQNTFKKRHKTSTINIQQLESSSNSNSNPKSPSQRQPQPQPQPSQPSQISLPKIPKKSPLKKNQTIRASHNNHNHAINESLNNPTQQSLVAMRQDDMEFNKINMDSSYKRERKLPRNKKRLQSLDLEEL